MSSRRPIHGVPLAAEVRRVAHVVLALVMASALIAASGILVTSQLRSGTAALRTQQEDNQALLRTLLTSQAAMRGYVATGDQALLAGSTGSGQLRDQAARVATSVGEGTEPAEQRAAVDQWVRFRDDLVRRRWSGEDVSHRLPGTPFPKVERANAAVDRALSARVADRSRWVGWSVAGSGLLVTCLLLALLTVLLRMRRDLVEHVVHPLEHLTSTVGSGPGGRAPTDTGPAEIRALSAVVNDYLAEAERNDAERLVEARVSRAKGEAALAIRRSLSEGAVLKALEEGLVRGMAASRVLVLRHAAATPIWRAVVDRASGEHRVVEVHRSRPLAPDLTECARVVGDETWLASVVRSDSRPEAVVLVTSTTPRTWAPAEKDLLEQVCEYAARGIDQSVFEAERAEHVSRLEALDRQKTDFMATVSHELRTPLTSIAGYLEMMEDGDFGAVDDEMRPVLGVLQRNTSRLRALIEDLLVLSRIEASGVDLDVTQVDVQELVDQVVENLQPQAMAGEVALVRRGRGPHLVIEGDQGQLERAVTNVVGNAVKFTPRGGRVVVDLVHDQDFVEIAVQDTGIGIPAEDLQDIGRRFFRARNVTSQTIPGTGLGLSIVQAIAQAHRGELRLDSVVGEGTCVTVRIARRVLRGAATGE